MVDQYRSQRSTPSDSRSFLPTERSQLKDVPSKLLVLLEDSVVVSSIRSYIKKTWKDLSRSHKHLLAAVRDTKVDHASVENKSPLYISTREDRNQVSCLHRI